MEYLNLVLVQSCVLKPLGSVFCHDGNLYLSLMQVMVEPYNIELEENSQEKCETKLNGVFQAHGCLPNMELVPVSLLLLIPLECMFG